MTHESSAHVPALQQKEKQERFPVFAVCFSAVVVAAYVVCRFVPLPGVDHAMLVERNVSETFTLGTISFFSFVEAFVVVELVAFVLPPLRKLRPTPAGRALLTRASLALGVVFVLVQVFVTINLLRALSWFGESDSVFVDDNGPLTAGGLLVLTALALIALARAGSRFGVANGMALMVAAMHVVDFAAAARVVAVGVQVGTVTLALSCVFFLLTGVAAIVSTRLSHDEGRSPVGVVPLILASLATGIVTALGGAHMNDAPLTLAVGFLVVVASAWLLTPVFGGSKQARLEGVAHALLLFGIGTWTARHGFKLDVVAVVVVVAVVRDVAAEVKARSQHADLVNVWPLHQSKLAQPALAALSAAGIEAHARGLHHRSALQLFGPWVPVEIFVPQAQAEQARDVVERVVLDPR